MSGWSPGARKDRNASRGLKTTRRLLYLLAMGPWAPKWIPKRSRAPNGAFGLPKGSHSVGMYEAQFTLVLPQRGIAVFHVCVWVWVWRAEAPGFCHHPPAHLSLCESQESPWLPFGPFVFMWAHPAALRSQFTTVAGKPFVEFVSEGGAALVQSQFDSSMAMCEAHCHCLGKEAA